MKRFLCPGNSDCVNTRWEHGMTLFMLMKYVIYGNHKEI